MPCLPAARGVAYDTEAPLAETIVRLRMLEADGRPIDLTINPGAITE